MRKYATKVKKTKLLVIEPSVRGESHILGNAGFINHVTEFYEEVTVIAEREHIDCLKNFIDDSARSKVAFHPWSSSGELTYNIIRLTIRGDFNRIIFLNVEFKLFLFVNIFFKFINVDKISWLLHSHFAGDAANDRRSTLRRTIKAVLLFNIFSKNEFLVYGGRIRENLSNLLGKRRIDGKLQVILHPISAKELRDSGKLKTSSLSTLPRILHLPGWHPLSERTKDFIEYIKSQSIVGGNFQFFSVENKFSIHNKIKTLTVPYRDRIAEIASYDLFLHLPEDSYRLQSSGSIMDSLLTLTPIIGIRTDFSEEIWSIIGPFGFFFDNKEELAKFLVHEKISRDRILEFQANLLDGYDKVRSESRKYFNH